MSEDQVYIMMQDCIPAVRNLAGEIAVDAQGHIIKKPHGHGDVHFCLYRVISSLDCQVGRRDRHVAAALRPPPRVLLPGHQHRQLLHHALRRRALSPAGRAHDQHMRQAPSPRAGTSPVVVSIADRRTVPAAPRERRRDGLQRRVQPARGRALPHHRSPRGLRRRVGVLAVGARAGGEAKIPGELQQSVHESPRVSEGDFAQPRHRPRVRQPQIQGGFRSIPLV